MMQTTNSSKLPFFAFGSANGRDDNHNDKSNSSFYNKDSSIAALEAFQREYLPKTSYPNPITQRIPSSLSGGRGSSPPRLPSPGVFPSPSTPRSSDSFHQSQNYDEQFKDLYEIDDNPRRKEFLDELFTFMQKRGTPINRLPVMAKHVLDLYELYNLVVEKGGLVEVINKKQWQEIIRDLKLPSSITSAAFTLRTQYTRYLYPYECKMQNLSRPSDLNAAVEGQRREGRRGFDDSPGPMGLMFPGHPPGSPFPYPLSPALTGALPGLMSPGIRDDSRLPMLPPTSINPGHPPRLPGLNPLDVTRLTLMKIMGQQNQMSFLPPTSPKQELQASGNEELPSPVKLKENSDKEEENKLEDDEEKKKLVVCIEINSIKYQGILFAQPPNSVNNVNSAVST